MVSDQRTDLIVKSSRTEGVHQKYGQTFLAGMLDDYTIGISSLGCG
jgi:hypothetical protein